MRDLVWKNRLLEWWKEIFEVNLCCPLEHSRVSTLTHIPINTYAYPAYTQEINQSEHFPSCIFTGTRILSKNLPTTTFVWGSQWQSLIWFYLCFNKESQDTDTEIYSLKSFLKCEGWERRGMNVHTHHLCLNLKMMCPSISIKSCYCFKAINLLRHGGGRNTTTLMRLFWKWSGGLVKSNLEVLKYMWCPSNYSCKSHPQGAGSYWAVHRVNDAAAWHLSACTDCLLCGRSHCQHSQLGLAAVSKMLPEKSWSWACVCLCLHVSACISV